MHMKRLLLFFVLFLAIVGAMDVFYTVHQTQQAIVLQLGKPVGGPYGPGLHFKLPLVQNVEYFDSRILEYDAQPAEILTSDKKTLVLDNFSKWRIADPLKFYQNVRTIPGAQARLDDIIYAQLRVALGRYNLTETVSTKRTEIMEQVTRLSSEQVKEFGIEVIDVRIKRTDLPPENERAIFGRMRAERERQAKQYRSEGQEESAKIKSMADREKTVILAEAKRQSEVIRGEGDGEATRIYAAALNQSPEFYAFKRSLEAYTKSFQDNTRLVLTPDSRFFRFMQ
ncbi:MAG: protease modulator HflC [Desulfovibrionaceae bacterium]